MSRIPSLPSVSISTLKVGDLTTRSGHWVSSVARVGDQYTVSIANKAGYTVGILEGDASAVVTYAGHDASLEPAPEPTPEERDAERRRFLRALGLSEEAVEQALLDRQVR